MLCNISQNAMGQTLGGGTLPGPAGEGEGGTLVRGVPWQVQLGGTLLGGYPGRSSGGYPAGGVPWSGPVGGYPAGGTLPGPAGRIPCQGGTCQVQPGGRGVPWWGYPARSSWGVPC